MIGEITELLTAFREGIGPETGLMLDLNFNQRTDGFIKVARAVEPYALTWLEIHGQAPEAVAEWRAFIDHASAHPAEAGEGEADGERPRRRRRRRGRRRPPPQSPPQ